jgi:hypothetical protein
MLRTLGSDVLGSRRPTLPGRRLGMPERTVGSFLPATGGPRVIKKQDRRNEARREHLVARVRGEFTEMPCLRVTGEEAARLFGLRADVCRRILDDLAGASAIRRAPDGRYSRLA